MDVLATPSQTPYVNQRTYRKDEMLVDGPLWCNAHDKVLYFFSGRCTRLGYE